MKSPEKASSFNTTKYCIQNQLLTHRSTPVGDEKLRESSSFNTSQPDTAFKTNYLHTDQPLLAMNSCEKASSFNRSDTPPGSFQPSSPLLQRVRPEVHFPELNFSVTNKDRWEPLIYGSPVLTSSEKRVNQSALSHPWYCYPGIQGRRLCVD